MNKFKYKIERIDGNPANLAAKLNERGEEGWEVVSIRWNYSTGRGFTNPLGNVGVVFKKCYSE